MDEGYRRQSSRRTATSGGAQPTAAAAPNQPNHAVPQVFPLGAAETDYPLGTKSIVKRGANYSPLLVDLSVLDMESLKRYVAQFDLPAPETATKEELVAIVSRHFVGHPHLREPEVVSAFIFANESARRALQEPVDEF